MQTINTKIIFDIEWKYVKGINEFASTDGERYALNGVLFESTGEDLRLTATDGHALGAIKLPIKCEPFRAIMPSRLINAFDAARMFFATISYEGRKFTISITEQEIDGKFPKAPYCVTPKEELGFAKLAVINLPLWQKFYQFSQIIGAHPDASGINVAQPETEKFPYVISLRSEPEFVGLLMPVFVRNFNPSVPAWPMEERPEIK
jgi:hypothetical protein